MSSRLTDSPVSGVPLAKRVFLIAGLIYAFSLGTRLMFLAEAVRDPMLRTPAVDEFTNWQVAEAILRGRLAPTPYIRAPGYLYLLAGLSALTGQESFLVRASQACLDAFGPVLMFLIGRRLFGPFAGVVAGLLGAVFWTCVLFSCQLVDTSLTCLECLCLAYLLVRLPDDRRWKWLACGFAAGIAAITRPNLLVFVPLMAVILLVSSPRHARAAAARCGLPKRTGMITVALLPAALLALGCTIAIAPVTIRNRVVSGEWVPICVSGGANLWIANRPGADGKDPAPCFDDDPASIKPPVTDDPWENVLGYRLMIRCARKHLGPNFRHSSMDRLFVNMTVREVALNPADFGVSVFKRLVWTLNAYEFPNNNDPYEFLRFSRVLRLLSYVHFGVLCPLAILGAALAMGRSAFRSPGPYGYLVLVVTLAATGAVFVICARYRLPIVCLLVPFAGYGVVELARMIRHPLDHTRVLAAAAAGLAVVAIISNTNLFAYRPEQRPVYLDWLYACACAEVGDGDLLPAAMATLGRRMAADAEAYPQRESMATIVRRYQEPFAFLAQYYLRENQPEEMLRYGGYMLRYEPYDDWKTRRYVSEALNVARRSGRPEIAYCVLDQVTPFLVLTRPELLSELRKNADFVAMQYLVGAINQAARSGRLQLAYQALEKLVPILRAHNRALLGEAYLTLGGAVNDKELLSKAKDIFGDLARLNPGDPNYGDKLDRTIRRLGEMSRTPQGTSPAASTRAAPDGGR